MRFFIERDQVARQATQNLIDAGQLTQGEVKDFLSTLDKLDAKDLLAVLMESHNLKEEHHAGNPIHSYPIDYLRMSGN